MFAVKLPMLRKIVILIAIFCAFNLNVVLASKPIEISYSTISNEDGMSQNNVYDIVQDNEGFMWFALNNGINRYDGHTIKEYLPGEGLKSFGNWTYRLYVDSRNTLWLMTYDGLGLYDRKNDEVVNINFISGQREDIRQVLGVREMSNGEILFNSTAGIFIFNYDSLKYRPLKIEGPESYEHNHITSIEELDNELFLFVGLYNVFEVNMATHKATRLFSIDKPENSEFVSNYSVKETIKDKNGDIWIFTFSGIHYKYSYRDKKVKKIKMPVDYLFYDAFYESDTTFLMSVDIYGLARYNVNTEEFTRIYGKNGNDSKIENNKVQVLYIDRQNIFWMGHFQSGVSYSYLNQDYFTTIDQSTYPDLFPVVPCVLRDSKNRLWLGTDGGGLYMFDKFGKLIGKYQENKNNKRSLQSNAILTLTEDSKNNIWVGTYSGGFVKYCEKTNDFDVYKYDISNQNGLPTNDIRQIKEDSFGNFWLITHGKGLTKYNIKTNEYTCFQMGLEVENKILNDWTWGLMFDSDNDLIVAGSRGLSILDTTRNIFRNYDKKIDNRNGLTSDLIFSVYQDTKNRIWCGTAKGLHQFFKNKGTYELIASTSRLAYISVNSIEEDDHGNLWLGTSKGIYKYTPDTGEEKVFLKADGVQGNEFVKNSVFKDSDGCLYFGGTEGLTYFHPDDILMNTKPPVAKITAIDVMGTKIPMQDMYNDTLYLNFNRNFITFYFAALNFINPQKNKYMYMLSGLETNWNPVTSEIKAVYTSLPPGKYIFKVKACNNDGIWNETPTDFLVIITPPWWQTIWFRIIVIASAIVIILLIFYIRLSSIKRMNKILERLVKKRTFELQEVNEELKAHQEKIEDQNKVLVERNEFISSQHEELKEKSEEITSQRDKLDELNKTKDKFFSIIAHDLKNPLNAMMGFADLLNNSFDKFPDDKKRKFIGIISDSSKNLYALLENLLSWARSQSGRFVYNPKKVSVNALINGTIASQMHHAARKDISLHFDENENFFVSVDENMISTVFRNLTSNAIKYTPKQGLIVFNVTPKDKYIEVSIKDSGVGMTDEQLNNLFKIDKTISTKGTDSEVGTGLGLILCNEFTVKNKGRIRVKSESGKGSIFYVELPIAERII